MTMTGLEAEMTDQLSNDGTEYLEPVYDRIAIVIMIEPGYLEWQSILLSCSLREYSLDPFKLYAYCRPDRIDKLHPYTVSYYRQNHDGIRPIPQPEFQVDYPQGNKIYACAEPRAEKTALFLDTDTVMLAPKNYFWARVNEGVSIKQGDIEAWCDDQDIWQHCYEQAGLSGPNLYLPNYEKRPLYPYYNAGFILFDNHAFAEHWKDISLKLDFDDKIPKKRPFLDQITLPIAIQRAKLRTGLLDSEWNGTFKYDLVEERNLILTHYHTAMKLVEFGYGHHANSLIAKHTKFESYYDLLKMYIEAGTLVLKPNYHQGLLDRGKDPLKFIRGKFIQNKML